MDGSDRDGFSTFVECGAGAQMGLIRFEFSREDKRLRHKPEVALAVLHGERLDALPQDVASEMQRRVPKCLLLSCLPEILL